MFSIFMTVLPVFGIIVFGMLVERRQLLPAEMASCLNQFVYWIALPTLLFEQLAGLEAGQIGIHYTFGIALGCVFSFLLAWPLCYFFVGSVSRKASITAMLSSFPNGAFLGFPVVHLLWPNEALALPLAAVCAAVTGCVVIAVDIGMMLGVTAHQDGSGFFSGCKRFVHTVIKNPLLVSTVVGAVYGTTGLGVPQPIAVAAGMLGSTAAPCALFCMGMILAAQMSRFSGKSHMGIRWHVLVHSLKLIVQPLVVGGCLWVAGLTGLPLAVGIVLTGMPTGMMAYVVAERHGVLADDTSIAIVISTALGLLSIPALMATIRALGWTV